MFSRPAVDFGLELSLATFVASGVTSCSPIGHPQSQLAAPLATTPTLDLGQLNPGEKAEQWLTLTNRSRVKVQLDRVESSCPCIRVTPLPANVDPGGRLDLRLRFDPAEEPDFRGRLAVDLTGLGRSGESLFRSTVGLTVAEAAPIQAIPSEPIPRVSGSVPTSSRPNVEIVP